ncbi:MAG: TolC family protein [Lacisediminimonas sp.]|nr:TolC family protein [Lacisediminimonas sp.]
MLALLLLLWPALSFATDPADPSLSRLSLGRALEIAAERNADMTLSALAITSAQANVLSADVSPNPSISLQAYNVNPRQGIGSGALRDKRVDTTVRVEQLIERGGKRQWRTENASHLVDASRAERIEVLRQLRLLVTIAYYDLLAAQDRLAITRDTANLFKATLDAAGKRRAAGDLAGSEVDRIRVEALRASNDETQAQAEHKRSRLALRLLMGISAPPADLRAEDAWPPLQPVAPQETSAVLADNPAVRAATARLLAAQSALRLAQASRTRDVSVGVQYDRSPASPMNSYVGSNTVGVSMQVPLFTSNYFEGEIRAAIAQVDTAQELVHKAQRQAESEMQRAQNELQSARTRLAMFQDQLSRSAQRAVDAAEFAFRNGAISVTDLLDTRRTYRAVAIDELQARVDYARADAAWRAVIMESPGK